MHETLCQQLWGPRTFSQELFQWLLFINVKESIQENMEKIKTLWRMKASSGIISNPMHRIFIASLSYLFFTTVLWNRHYSNFLMRKTKLKETVTFLRQSVRVASEFWSDLIDTADGKYDALRYDRLPHYLPYSWKWVFSCHSWSEKCF